MKKFIKKLYSDKIVFLSTLLSTLFFLLSIIGILIYFPLLPTYIPLFHQAPWGVERLGKKLEIFLPAAYVGITIIGNVFFSYYIYEKMPLVSRIVAITTLLLNFILLLFTIRTIQLVM